MSQLVQLLAQQSGLFMNGGVGGTTAAPPIVTSLINPPIGVQVPAGLPPGTGPVGQITANATYGGVPTTTGAAGIGGKETDIATSYRINTSSTPTSLASHLPDTHITSYSPSTSSTHTHHRLFTFQTHTSLVIHLPRRAWLAQELQEEVWEL